MRELREWKRRNPAVPTKPPFCAATIRAAIDRDPSLSTAQQEEMQGWLNDPNTLQKLQSEGVGATLGYAAAKFLNLKPQTQLLLSIAGFGVGKIMYDFKNNPKKFSTFNPQLRMYEIHD